MAHGQKGLSSSARRQGRLAEKTKQVVPVFEEDRMGSACRFLRLVSPGALAAHQPSSAITKDTKGHHSTQSLLLPLGTHMWPPNTNDSGPHSTCSPSGAISVRRQPLTVVLTGYLLSGGKGPAIGRTPRPPTTSSQALSSGQRDSVLTRPTPFPKSPKSSWETNLKSHTTNIVKPRADNSPALLPGCSSPTQAARVPSHWDDASLMLGAPPSLSVNHTDHRSLKGLVCPQNT